MESAASLRQANRRSGGKNILPSRRSRACSPFLWRGKAVGRVGRGCLSLFFSALWAERSLRSGSASCLAHVTPPPSGDALSAPVASCSLRLVRLRERSLPSARIRARLPSFAPGRPGPPPFYSQPLSEASGFGGCRFVFARCGGPSLDRGLAPARCRSLRLVYCSPLPLLPLAPPLWLTLSLWS